MIVQLKPDLEKYIAEKVRAGQNADASDIINEALELFREQEEFIPKYEPTPADPSRR
jgi:Arc/MetJ-type ribon-helix-helix transcriptional regulator